MTIRTEPEADIRRVVVVDEGEHSKVIADSPSPDIRTDPARPGFSLHRMWVGGPIPIALKGLRESLDAPNVMVPPARGSVCYVAVFPPERTYLNDVTAADVDAYFESVGAPSISQSGRGSHPYMQKSRTLDFALILEGEITLVLDLEEVELSAGDIVVQRGTSHAWSNRSERPCVIAFSTHDGDE
jgi:mannose-6-phosphate isomerase-like protein (cupin superfamily)